MDKNLTKAEEKKRYLHLSIVYSLHMFAYFQFKTLGSVCKDFKLKVFIRSSTN